MKLPLTKQDYSKKPTIDGVKIVDVNVHTDDGGYFLELMRMTDMILDHFPKFTLRQLNFSEMDSGTIKAWHLHKHQDDIWFVPPSQRLLLAMKDVREDSPTNNILMRMVLGHGKGKLIFIPRGVAHGAANFWQHPAMVLYFVSEQFHADPEKNDEYRLPWDHFGPEIWQMTKG